MRSIGIVTFLCPQTHKKRKSNRTLKRANLLSGCQEARIEVHAGQSLPLPQPYPGTDKNGINTAFYRCVTLGSKSLSEFSKVT